MEIKIMSKALDTSKALERIQVFVNNQGPYMDRITYIFSSREPEQESKIPELLQLELDSGKWVDGIESAALYYAKMLYYFIEAKYTKVVSTALIALELLQNKPEISNILAAIRATSTAALFEPEGDKIDSEPDIFGWVQETDSSASLPKVGEVSGVNIVWGVN
jgi:hypothetical protein